MGSNPAASTINADAPPGGHSSCRVLRDENPQGELVLSEQGESNGNPAASTINADAPPGGHSSCRVLRDENPQGELALSEQGESNRKPKVPRGESRRLYRFLKWR